MLTALKSLARKPPRKEIKRLHVGIRPRAREDEVRYISFLIFAGFPNVTTLNANDSQTLAE